MSDGVVIAVAALAFFVFVIAAATTVHRLLAPIERLQLREDEEFPSYIVIDGEPSCGRCCRPLEVSEEFLRTAATVHCYRCGTVAVDRRHEREKRGIDG